MAPLHHFIMLWLWLAALSVASATDHNSIVDYCVADPNPVMVNGFLCKDPKKVQADDFFFSGLQIRRNTTNARGIGMIRLDSGNLPGLNKLGISFSRTDFAPGFRCSLYYHPGAAEILFLTEGTVEVGFITSNPENRLFTKILEKGDVFVLPEGLVHFLRNVGEDTAVAFAVFNSENYPHTVNAADAAFGSEPAIPREVLARAFRVDESIIEQIASKF